MINDESFGIVPLSHEGGIWKVFLILHKGGNHWGFPKGHAHSNETPVQAATRELKEETGLEVVRLLMDAPLVEQYQFRKKDQLISKKVSYFPAEVSGELALQKEEILEGKWLLLETASKQLSFKEARSICQQLVNYLKS